MSPLPQFTLQCCVTRVSVFGASLHVLCAMATAMSFKEIIKHGSSHKLIEKVKTTKTDIEVLLGDYIMVIDNV